MSFGYERDRRSSSYEKRNKDEISYVMRETKFHVIILIYTSWLKDILVILSF